MINSKDLINLLKKNKINFYSGVPDSVLKSLTPYLNKNNNKHIIATNEGSAVSIAIGYHLKTKKIPCVYMQNSGLGNAINPLSSIAHPKVYSVPLLLIIGWRGAPNISDEPQHEVKGKITTKLLDLLDIEYCYIKNKKDFSKLNNLIKKSKKKLKPVACLIDNKTLIQKKEIKKNKILNNSKILRSDFIKEFLEMISKDSLIISSTGYASRELMQIRNLYKFNKGKDFYMVGGMGHTTSVSLGASLFSKKNTFCIDGDGSMLMHLGSLFTFSLNGKKNLKYILINNNSHESVGSQPTFINKIDLRNFSKSLGFKKYFIIKNKKDMRSIIEKFLKYKKMSFLEVLTKTGTIKNLLRPKNLIEIKNKFIK